MIENVSTQLTVFHCFAHCLLPGRAFASLYALLFLEKEAEIGGRGRPTCKIKLTFHTPLTSGVGWDEGSDIEIVRISIYFLFIKLSTKTYLTGFWYDLNNIKGQLRV